MYYLTPDTPVIWYCNDYIESLIPYEETYYITFHTTFTELNVFTQLDTKYLVKYEVQVGSDPPFVVNSFIQNSVFAFPLSLPKNSDVKISWTYKTQAPFFTGIVVLDTSMLEIPMVNHKSERHTLKTSDYITLNGHKHYHLVKFNPTDLKQNARYIRLLGDKSIFQVYDIGHSFIPGWFNDIHLPLIGSTIELKLSLSNPIPENIDIELM